MNLADRLKARGTNESRTGAIPVTEARREPTYVCVYSRALFGARRERARVGAVELGGKANKTCASLSFSALQRRLEQRPLISRAVNRDFFSLSLSPFHPFLFFISLLAASNSLAFASQTTRRRDYIPLCEFEKLRVVGRN